VPLVAKQLAEIHNLPVEEIGEITTRNACELFRVE
jgi:Tat protein secretion system quality control protein TatD with DNase activity